MNLAISNIAWNKEESDEISEILECYRISCIEGAPSLLVSDPSIIDESEIQSVKEYWAQRGISIKAMQALLFGQNDLVLFETGPIRARLTEYLNNVVTLSGKIGAEKLVFGSPKNRAKGETDFEKALDIASDFFRTVGDHCSRTGTVMCFEPNAPEYGCDFGSTTKEAVDIVKAINHEAVGLNLDLGVITMNGEDVQSTFQEALPYIQHIHISEPYLEAINPNNPRHALLAQSIKESDYQGFVSVEMKKSNDTNNKKHVEAALDFVLRTYG